MANVVEVFKRPQSWHLKFVFVKTFLGSKSFGRYGLYDQHHIILSDLTVVDPKSVVFIEDMKLYDAMEAAKRHGLYYKAWEQERDIWLSHVDTCGDAHANMIHWFDGKWQRIESTFIVTPTTKSYPKRKELKSNDIKDEDFDKMFENLDEDTVPLHVPP